MKEDLDDFVSVSWLGDKHVNRPGRLGWILDLLLGKQVVPGPNLFCMTRRNGEVLTSPDGIVWTTRTTPISEHEHEDRPE
jgi:hypothetical protein